MTGPNGFRPHGGRTFQRSSGDRAPVVQASTAMRTLGGRLRRGTLWAFLIVMPIGIRIDSEHGSELTVEGHVGTGQVYSIIRDCSGDQVAAARNTYTDQAGAVQYSMRTDGGNFIVMGLRGGRLQADFKRATQDPTATGSRNYEYTYWNPHLTLESPYLGIGFGYLGNAPSFDFGEPLSEFGDSDSSFPVSGHLRIGNYAAAYFLASVNENLPLASGGGYMHLGVGYPVAERAHFFTGLTAAPYDMPGFLQKVSWQVSERFDLDLNGRVGWTEGNPEFGVSLGLRYHLPLGARSGPNPFLERRRREGSGPRTPGIREIGSLDPGSVPTGQQRQDGALPRPVGR